MAYAFEYIGVFFLLIMIYFSYLVYKKKELTRFGLIFWILLWLGGIFLILFHNYFNYLLSPLNIIRIMDLYMIIAFMILFSLVFYLFVKKRKLEKKLEEITRQIALKPLNDS
jgi:hypothetical protein